MKKILLFAIPLFILAACGGGSKKVRNFAETFVNYVNEDQMDSIKVIYPTANFDSIAPISADSISVSEIGSGVYRVNFSANKWIDVKAGEYGMTIVESRGIASFPEKKYEIAVNTGMVSDTTNDVRTQELLNDSTYFEWLKRNYSNGGNVIQIKAGKIKFFTKPSWGEASQGSVTITLSNLSDSPISGNDYYITYMTRESNGLTDNGRRDYNKANKHNGIDLEPKGSCSITLSKMETYKFFDFEVKPAEGKESVLNYEFKPSGNEYQEYLKEQAESANTNYDWLSTREVTPKDLENKTPEQLRIMRNWIYARHGYIFKSPDLTEYFSKFSWYNPTSKNVTSQLNKIELANIQAIQAYE